MQKTLGKKKGKKEEKEATGGTCTSADIAEAGGRWICVWWPRGEAKGRKEKREYTDAPGAVTSLLH